jgi:hypothetical protein
MKSILKSVRKSVKPFTRVFGKYASKRSTRTIFWIWLGWLVALLGYQAFIQARLELARPDFVLSWTPRETEAGRQDDKPYLIDPFMNAQVSWDSEFYLAIAVDGYNSPLVRTVPAVVGESQTLADFWPFGLPPEAKHAVPPSMSHAFFPFYPLVARVLSWALAVLGMNTIATATLAAVTVSALGTLAGMLALYQLARDELGKRGALRAVFYLVIFPTGFFLAQVYTEGLFVGLAFWSLVLMRRGELGWAAVLAIAATFTRAVGVALVVPLAYAWWQTGEWKRWQAWFNRHGEVSWPMVRTALIVASPLIAFLIWKVSYYGLVFTAVEDVWFGRGLLDIEGTIYTWGVAFQSLFGENTQAAAYYWLEFAAVIFGFAACVAGFRRHPDLAAFGFLVIFFSFTSGSAQGMLRYVLVAPPLFLLLARWGENEAFDRVWTVASVLLMSVMAALFTFDMWAG